MRTQIGIIGAGPAGLLLSHLLLQLAVYAGVPSANRAFAIARRVSADASDV